MAGAMCSEYAVVRCTVSYFVGHVAANAGASAIHAVHSQRVDSNTQPNQ